MNWAKSLLTRKRFQKSNIILGGSRQSVTSRLETSQYRDFSQFFKSIGLSLENFGLKKSLSNDLKKFVLENFGLQKLWTW